MATTLHYLDRGDGCGGDGHVHVLTSALLPRGVVLKLRALTEGTACLWFEDALGFRVRVPGARVFLFVDSLRADAPRVENTYILDVENSYAVAAAGGAVILRVHRQPQQRLVPENGAQLREASRQICARPPERKTSLRGLKYSSFSQSL